MPNFSIFNLKPQQLKNFIHGQQFATANILPIATTPEGILNVQTKLSPFDNLQVLERTALIELVSIYGISELRDLITTSGNATVTNNGTEFILETTTNGDDRAVLDSAERGRYFPGTAAEAGIAVRIPENPSGNQVATWGYFDDENGAFYGFDSIGIFVEIRRDGVQTAKVRQENWNADPLDGTGPSGVTLTPSNGNIYQIIYTWYGYGTIEFRILLSLQNNIQTFITVHRFHPTDETSFADPNLPIRAEIVNGGTITTFNLFVAGRQYAILGRYDPGFRITSDRRISEAIGDANFEPTVSFQRKTIFPDVSPPVDRANSVSVKIDGFDIVTTQDVIYELRIGSDLTNAIFGDPTNTYPNETALLSDTSATAINVSTGNLVYSGLVSAAGKGQSVSGLTQVTGLDIELPGQQIITLAVRSLDGAATVSSVLRVTEEW